MFPKRFTKIALAIAMSVSLLPGAALGFTGEVQVGAGSYSTVKPPGVNDVQSTIYKTANVTGKMPTNDWWSSTAWVQYSDAQYPHPLAVLNQASGLRVYYPGPSITGNSACVCGWLEASNSDDFTIGHTGTSSFPDAKVDGFNDWFVTNLFQSGGSSLKVTYGHGSPYVYATYAGGNPKLTFSAAPTVWSGNASSPVLGVTINNRHYGLFGPTGSTWTGIGSATLTNNLNGKNYFSIAVLPDNSAATLNKFKQYAYAHVTDTKVSWSYHAAGSEVVSTYTFTTSAKEGSQTGTLFAMYPHQWKHSTGDNTAYSYASVRGTMKVGEGTSFQTVMKFHGVLPSLPDLGTYDRNTLKGYIDQAEAEPYGGEKDTYWLGKRLGKLSTLAPIADQMGDTTAATRFRNEIKTHLQNYLKASDASGALESELLFYYNNNWGTLIGYPDSFGSAVELNDHHFHYGYFVKAAAEIARVDKAWANDSQWGGMIKLLVRDIANPNRSDAMFPFLRNYDVYAGHTWASGHARFGDGNNNESSSEAMNAWTGLILWGEATGDTALRDLGIFLYTNEMNAINEYWFDVHDQNHHPNFTRATASMIWGGKVVGDGVWWTGNPEEVHGINWLPYHGGSLYLTQYPAYTKKNYDALVAENGGANWNVWEDLIWMYRAIENPADAINQFNARAAAFTPEAGNSKAMTYHWIHNLNALGTTDLSVTADTPIYAVFKKGTAKTYVAYNMSSQSKTVRFSDGMTLSVPANSFNIGNGSGSGGGEGGGTGNATYSAADYVVTVSQPSVSSAAFSFAPTSPATYAILHYKVNQGGQVNVNATQQNGAWVYAIGGLAAGQTIDFFYTYTKNGLQYDSPWYAYTVGSGGSGGGGTADTQAPSAPTGLASPAKTDTTVSLTWNAASDNVGVAAYKVFQGAAEIGSTTGTSYQATGLAPSTGYTFTVKAVDAAGNVSAASNAATVTTNAARIVTADYAIETVRKSATEVELRFTPTNPATYVILHASAGGGTQQNVQTTNSNGVWTYTLGGLSAGTQIVYSYTYTKNGLQYDSPNYSYTH